MGTVTLTLSQHSELGNSHTQAKKKISGLHSKQFIEM